MQHTQPGVIPTCNDAVQEAARMLLLQLQKIGPCQRSNDHMAPHPRPYANQLSTNLSSKQQRSTASGGSHHMCSSPEGKEMSTSSKCVTPRGDNSQSGSSLGMLQSQLMLLGCNDTGKSPPGNEATGEGLHLDGGRVAPGVVSGSPGKLPHSSPHVQH